MRILKINVSNNSFEVVDNDVKGVIEYSINEHLSNKTYEFDPLSPNNKLIISAGLLVNKRLPGSYRAIISGRSPLTNGFFMSSVGGFGEAIISAGVSTIELVGKADKPSVIIVNNTNGEISVKIVPINLSVYKPDGVFSLQEWLVNEFGDKFSGVYRSLVAGPSGFNTILGGLSSVAVKNGALDYGSEGFAGRGGFGSVMAQAHNIAGLMIGGSEELVNDDVNKIISDEWLGLAAAKTEKYRGKGTLWSNYESLINDALMFNWNSVLLNEDERIKLYNKLIRDSYLKEFKAVKIISKTCGENCPALCKKVQTKHVKDYEPYSSCGPNLGIFTQAEAERVVNTVDSLGFDGISVGNLLSTIFEAISKGVISASSVGLDAEPVFDYKNFSISDSSINARLAVKLLNKLAWGELPKLAGGIRSLGFDFSVINAFGSKGMIAPNQYLRPGFIAPLPILGKFTTYYGKEWIPPRELGKRSAERLIKELYFEDNGYCRFHRGWIEGLMPELMNALHNGINYYEHIKSIINKIIIYNLNSDSMPVFWINQKMKDLVKAFVLMKGDDEWVKKFNDDPDKAIKEYWDEMVKGVGEVLGEVYINAMESREELINRLRIHADKNNIQLNPNEVVLKGVIDGLIRNKLLTGRYYCPCRLEHKEEYVCPCDDHLTDIERDGHCHCFLFVKKNNK